MGATAPIFLSFGSWLSGRSQPRRPVLPPSLAPRFSAGAYGGLRGHRYLALRFSAHVRTCACIWALQVSNVRVHLAHLWQKRPPWMAKRRGHSGLVSSRLCSLSCASASCSSSCNLPIAISGRKTRGREEEATCQDKQREEEGNCGRGAGAAGRWRRGWVTRAPTPITSPSHVMRVCDATPTHIPHEQRDCMHMPWPTPRCPLTLHMARTCLEAR